MTIDRSQITVDETADARAYGFIVYEQGYQIKGTYLNEPKGEALIEISKNGKTVREFLWPSYKIWNISAHAKDIVDGLISGSDNGLLIAGSDGLGGNVYGQI